MALLKAGSLITRMHLIWLVLCVQRAASLKVMSPRLGADLVGLRACAGTCGSLTDLLPTPTSVLDGPAAFPPSPPEVSTLTVCCIPRLLTTHYTIFVFCRRRMTPPFSWPATDLHCIHTLESRQIWQLAHYYCVEANGFAAGIPHGLLFQVLGPPQ